MVADLVTLALVSTLIHTTFFQNTFGARLENRLAHVGLFRSELHTIAYLQVAIISQTLILISRSHGFSLTERPSSVLNRVFCATIVVMSIIALYAN
jgi:H+-transporting ATPase